MSAGSRIGGSGSGSSFAHALVVSSDPATGTNGQFIINSTTNTLKVYYAGQWQTVTSLSGTSSTAGLYMGLPIGLTYPT